MNTLQNTLVIRIRDMITQDECIDTSTDSPHFFYRKWIGATNENVNFDVRVLNNKSVITKSDEHTV